MQLARASGLALLSMTIIIVTIITQGARVPQGLRGTFEGSMLVKDGIAQAIGVISFGQKALCIRSMCGADGS